MNKWKDGEMDKYRYMYRCMHIDWMHEQMDV